MRYVARGLALAGLSLGLAFAPAAGTAGAAPAPAPAGATSLYAPSALVLTVTAGDDAVDGTVLRAVTLECAPGARGSHPAPEDACGELRAQAGGFDASVALDPDRACTKQWDPVTVTATGVWEGRHVSYSHTFGNPCVKSTARGVLFSF
ncbi:MULTISPECIES: subtilase-type protease inhibitor [Streptomyces]|uniref:Probable subtilase-type protease inhibitor n=1 Tax=Streptomyces sanyensis TaxID=568869 RepID=A0ABP8ZR77_9ACTN